MMAVSVWSLSECGPCHLSGGQRSTARNCVLSLYCKSSPGCQAVWQGLSSTEACHCPQTLTSKVTITFSLQTETTHEDAGKCLTLTLCATEEEFCVGLAVRGSRCIKQGCQEGPALHTLLRASCFSLLGSLSSAQPWLELGIHTGIHRTLAFADTPGSKLINVLWSPPWDIRFEMPVSTCSLHSAFYADPGSAFALFIWLFIPPRFLLVLPGCKLELLETASSFPVTRVLFTLIYWSKNPFNGALVAWVNGCLLSNCLIASWAWLGHWTTSRVLFLFISLLSW